MCGPKSAGLSHCFRITLREGRIWQSCGKPSTKFPHGGLVECPFISYFSYLSFLKISKILKILDIFLKIFIFSKFLEIWNLMEPMFFITFSSFYHIHIDLRYTLDTESLALFIMSSTKNLLTQQNSGGVLPFFASPSLASLAIVSVWQSCGKPSTKFPHGALVECLFFFHSFSKFPTISLNF